MASGRQPILAHGGRIGFMKIGISLLNFMPGKVGGIETYIRKLIQFAPGLAGKDEIVFFVHRDNRASLPADVAGVELPWGQRQVDAARILEAFTPWRARAVESLIADSGVDVMLFTQQSMFPLHCPVPSVLLVADVQYLISPHYYSWLDLRFRKRIYVGSMHACSKIIAISSVTATHLQELCDISPEKIVVIHLGFDQVRELGETVPRLPDGPYLYYPAATHRHKGHAQLFRTFAQLKGSGRIPHKLVLTGSRNAYWKILARVINDEGMQAEITHLGFVTYGQVETLYAGADAVLFPTEFEGFGIPVLEAMSRQKKIICSRLPIFEELGVPSGWQVDFACPEQLLQALVSRGFMQFNIRHFSWQETITESLGNLRLAVESRNRVSS